MNGLDETDALMRAAGFSGQRREGAVIYRHCRSGRVLIWSGSDAPRRYILRYAQELLERVEGGCDEACDEL